MSRLALRRPSPATVIALLALFVAAGVPAEAAKLLDGKNLKPRSVTGKAIKPRSIGLDRLRTDGVRALTATPLNEVTGVKVADSSLTGADLAADTLGQAHIAQEGVGASEIAGDTIDFDEIIDGGLGARDVGSFGGSFGHDFGTIGVSACATVTKEAAEIGPRQGVTRNVFDDVIVVTPPSSYPDNVMVQVAPSAARQIDVTVCNLTGGPIDPPDALFRYLSFDF